MLPLLAALFEATSAARGEPVDAPPSSSFASLPRTFDPTPSFELIEQRVERALAELEDQLVQFIGDPKKSEPADRLDALVWGMHYLLQKPAGVGVSSEGMEGGNTNPALDMLYRPRGGGMFGRRTR